MTAESLANRILQGETRIAGHNIRTGNLDGIQVQERDCVRQMVASWKFSICASSMTVGQIATRARIFAAQLGQPLDLICVDYLQLMKPDGGDTRAQEVSQIAWSLKTLAMELGVPVMALSQLNRAGVVNPDEPPELHNLKESGDIENHANSVILLHRSKKAALDTAGAVPIWCRIAKCRDGLTTPWPAPAGKDHIPGSITLRFRPEWTRYE